MGQNLITINYAGESVQVDYKPGYRPLQFMFKNKLSDEDKAKEMFARAKEAHAAKLNTTIQAKNLKPLKATEKVNWKNNTFMVTAAVEYDAGEATEEHVELIKKYLDDKKAQSDKAIERVNNFLAQFEGKPAKKVA
jgi:hypothetical protein